MGLTATFLLAITLATSSVPGKPPRSACNKQTQGLFWPDKANTDRKLASQLMRSGDLHLCTRGIFRYSWQPLTVNYQTLVSKVKGAGRVPQAPAASGPEIASR